MKYEPRNWHWVGPPAIILAGFYIRQNVGQTWDVYFTMVMLQISGILYSFYLWQAGVLWQGAYTDVMKRTGHVPFRPPEVVKAIPNLNNVNSKTVSLPRLDPERQIANILCSQHEHGFKIDLTEKYWIKPPRKFTGKRDDFAAIMRQWSDMKILERKDPRRGNSPYVVRDWVQVEMIREGTHPLQQGQ